jgi:glutamate 5-kinase
MNEELKSVDTVVIKIGTSSLLTDDGSSLDLETLGRYVHDIADLWKQGKMVVLVTSGAAGLGRLREGGNISTATMRGQPDLMEDYKRLFGEYGILRGQMLLSKGDFSGRRKTRRIVNRIKTSFVENTITIINENDATSHKKKTFGDNDTLAAIVAKALKADMVVFLSRNGSTTMGRGGNDAKKKAIKKLHRRGIPAPVVDGKQPNVLAGLFDGDGKVLRQALRDSSLIRKSRTRI